LNAIAERRGQSLAQMAITWVLRNKAVTSALVGARTVAQLEELLAAVNQPALSVEELAEIDTHATEGGIDLWRVSSELSAGDLPV
jgi:L-glyceraldehyde 3-phosphate reductase